MNSTAETGTIKVFLLDDCHGAQQVRPRLRRLPITVSQGYELLAAVRTHADHHQQAQPVLVPPDVHVDPVGP